jgi:hypothetical protein
MPDTNNVHDTSHGVQDCTNVVKEFLDEIRSRVYDTELLKKINDAEKCLDHLLTLTNRPSAEPNRIVPECEEGRDKI